MIKDYDSKHERRDSEEIREIKETRNESTSSYSYKARSYKLGGIFSGKVSYILAREIYQNGHTSGTLS